MEKKDLSQPHSCECQGQDTPTVYQYLQWQTVVKIGSVLALGNVEKNSLETIFNFDESSNSLHQNFPYKNIKFKLNQEFF